MHFRKLHNSDLPDINQINQQQDFRLDDLQHCVIDGVIIHNNEVVAYGIVKRQAEAIILVDKNKPKITRARALRELMRIAILGAKADDCKQLHCFVSDVKVAELLKRKFGFVETKDIVLVRDL